MSIAFHSVSDSRDLRTVTAVGQSGAFQSSPDGIVWQISTCPGLAIASAQAAEGSGVLENDGGFMTIEDNDVGVGITDAAVNEWEGPATVTVALSGPTLQTVTFDYRTEPGNATAGEDYLPGTSPGLLFKPTRSLSV